MRYIFQFSEGDYDCAGEGTYERTDILEDADMCKNIKGEWKYWEGLGMGKVHQIELEIIDGKIQVRIYV